MHYNAKGTVYITLEWVFVLVQVLAITLRLYSRTFLTRSVGSDDLFIVIGFAVGLGATVPDIKAFLNGWAQHESTLTPAENSAEEKWEYIGYIQVYIAFFFVRASVMLFVLRLLPSYKKWQQRMVNLVFLINFLVTAYTCITFGVSCIPYKANWEAVPNSKCFSKDLLAITNQVNAALACVCDIATALIPQFLLWGVQMKAKTKRQLSILFGLGLITAALSIARAATITKKALNEDTTWNMIPAYYFTMFESKLGIIFACGPAIRQFWAYRSRTHSCLPTKNRQYPNEDFIKMRYRVNLRDILWYRKAQVVDNKVYDATPIFRSRSPPPNASSGHPQSSSHVSDSVLDVWEKGIKRVFRSGRHHSSRHPFSETVIGTPSEVSEKQKPREASGFVDLSSKEPHAGRRWGLLSPKSESSTGSSNGANFLLSASGAGTCSTVTTQDETSWPLDQSESRIEPVQGSQKA